MVVIMVIRGRCSSVGRDGGGDHFGMMVVIVVMLMMMMMAAMMSDGEQGNLGTLLECR